VSKVFLVYLLRIKAGYKLANLQQLPNYAYSAGCRCCITADTQKAILPKGPTLGPLHILQLSCQHYHSIDPALTWQLQSLIRQKQNTIIWPHNATQMRCENKDPRIYICWRTNSNLIKHYLKLTPSTHQYFGHVRPCLLSIWCLIKTMPSSIIPPLCPMPQAYVPKQAQCECVLAIIHDLWPLHTQHGPHTCIPQHLHAYWP